MRKTADRRATNASAGRVTVGDGQHAGVPVRKMAGSMHKPKRGAWNLSGVPRFELSTAVLKSPSCQQVLGSSSPAQPIATGPNCQPVRRGSRTPEARNTTNPCPPVWRALCSSPGPPAAAVPRVQAVIGRRAAVSDKGGKQGATALRQLPAAAARMVSAACSWTMPPQTLQKVSNTHRYSFSPRPGSPHAAALSNCPALLAAGNEPALRDVARAVHACHAVES